MKHGTFRIAQLARRRVVLRSTLQFDNRTIVISRVLQAEVAERMLDREEYVLAHVPLILFERGF